MEDKMEETKQEQKQLHPIPVKFLVHGRVIVNFTPSPTAIVTIKKSNGQLVEIKMNRKDRRKYLRRIG